MKIIEAYNKVKSSNLLESDLLKKLKVADIYYTSLKGAVKDNDTAMIEQLLPKLIKSLNNIK